MVLLFVVSNIYMKTDAIYRGQSKCELSNLSELSATSLSAFHTFVRLAFVWFCLSHPLLSVWKGLWFVIVALPGLFSYPFFTQLDPHEVNSSLIFKSMYF